MYPSERSLVKRLEGKPFVLLGINSDPKDRLRNALKQQNMTWRSWWDGGSTGGPIASNWGIRGWPTMFLIDHKGVIRQQYVGSPGEETLNQELNKLLAEVKSAKD